MKTNTISKQNAETTASRGLKIVMIGEGGQGIQTVAKIVTHSAFEFGYHASYLPNFGTEQRGGLSIAFIQISESEIISPKFKTADLFILVSNRDVARTLQYIGPTTNVLYDEDILLEDAKQQLARHSKNLVPIRAFYQATHAFTERSFNVILLGIIIGLVDLNLKELAVAQMTEKFKKYYEKKPELKTTNEQAFQLGLTMTTQK